MKEGKENEIPFPCCSHWLAETLRCVVVPVCASHGRQIRGYSPQLPFSCSPTRCSGNRTAPAEDSSDVGELRWDSPRVPSKMGLTLKAAALPGSAPPPCLPHTHTCSSQSPGSHIPINLSHSNPRFRICLWGNGRSPSAPVVCMF